MKLLYIRRFGFKMDRNHRYFAAYKGFGHDFTIFGWCCDEARPKLLKLLELPRILLYITEMCPKMNINHYFCTDIFSVYKTFAHDFMILLMQSLGRGW